MRVLVSGSSGFLGLNLLKELSNTNLDILGLYNKRKPQDVKSKNIKLLKKNIKYFNSTKIIKKFKPNILIHLAWKDIPDFSLIKSRENLNLSKNFIREIIKIKSIRKIIVTGSSFEENINSNNYYFVQAKKNLRDWLLSQCKSKNIDFGWLRFFYVYGPKQKKTSLVPYLIETLKKKNIPSIKNLNNYNDFIFVDDVSKLIIGLMYKKLNNKIFYIGTGKLNSVRSVSHLVEKSVNKKNVIFKKGDKVIKLNFNKKKDKNNRPIFSFKKFKFTSLKNGIKKTILEK